ncbi:KR domain-containing protein, partial [candidate division KSB1 bacterium]|nr:KR domain-containing protein [candidate division KSB1 bacterium]NIS25217.1 KR domain-containing protein [candidate division KSB1 bacterium]NIT72125.1 KR domain-containing protein [candidate division KSB1 bacterium]NIU28679.1 KR domain-containing protein [candidate division KSB1 bacterium]NIU94436.1 KR domain-containing protein [candidate division KSB1 bacterium]
ILHLWSVDLDISLQSESLKSALDSGFNSLLLLARALGEGDFSKPLSIEIISNGLQEVIGEEVIQPVKATLLGPCRVISQEFPDVVCRSIDIVLPDDKSEQAQVVEQLITEIHSKPSSDVVAYRGNHRWVQNFEPLYLNNNDSPARLRQGGVYLITGGVGGIGLALAEYLAETVQAKLILTARKELPQRNQWKEWLAKHDDADDTSRKIRKVQELEALGRCGSHGGKR